MNILFFLLLVVTTSSAGLYPKQKDTIHRPPIIFVPGDGGCQLEAKINKTSTVHFLCEKTTSEYFVLWLNIELLVPVIIDCWVDNMKLQYDNVTRTTRNQPGVDIRVPGFGDPTTVEWLDPLKIKAIGSYFSYISDALVDVGYERNVNIKGAPFDFRKAPNENADYFKSLKVLVEETYELNGNTSVILVAHSMGGPMSLYFLQTMSQKWKDKYIRSIITLSAAWAGSVKAVKVFLIGDDLGVFLLPDKILQQIQITMPSLAWLMPSADFWKPDEVLVQTAQKNYTLRNMRDLFEDIDYMTGWEMVVDQMAYRDFTPPGVEVHCLHGYGVGTLDRVLYTGDILEGNPTLIDGDGDGTVNMRSLRACTTWQGKQNRPVFHQTFANLDHMGILKDDRILSYVTNLVQSYAKHDKKKYLSHH